MHYLQDFNFHPYESYKSSNFFSCDDDAYDGNPDWGWAKDSNGDNILHSQGFWCSCDIWDFLGFEDSYKRAATWETFDFGSSASAHCLRWHDTYYHSYEPQNAILGYTIGVAVRK